MTIQISAALRKINGRLQDRNLTDSQIATVMAKLPKAWQRSATNFTRFNALRQGQQQAIADILKMDDERFDVWEKAGVGIDEAAVAAVGEAREKIEAAKDGEIFLILETGGQFQLLSLAELEALDTTSLDEKAVIEQLTP